MDLVFAIGLSAGVLAGLLQVIAGPMGVLTWVSFISWLCFYASGTGLKALAKTVPSNIEGLVGGFLIIFLSKLIPLPYSIGISVMLIVVAMCLASKWSVLSFIPGAFAGCSCYFGAGASTSVFLKVLVALLIGAVLGYVSEFIGIQLSKIGKKKEKAVEPEKLAG